jgi:hypothetical protein
MWNLEQRIIDLVRELINNTTDKIKLAKSVLTIIETVRDQAVQGERDRCINTLKSLGVPVPITLLSGNGNDPNE